MEYQKWRLLFGDQFLDILDISRKQDWFQPENETIPLPINQNQPDQGFLGVIENI